MEDTTKKYRTVEFSIRLGTKWTMVTLHDVTKDEAPAALQQRINMYAEAGICSDPKDYTIIRAWYR